MPKTRKAAADPFKTLMSDHRKAEALMKRIKGLSDKQEDECGRLYAELKEMMTVHMRIEEKVLYPTLEEVKVVRDIVCEGFEEHHVAKVLFKELDSDKLTSEVWHAKFKVLKENIDHHVEEEEEDMFPKARRALKADQRELLASELEAFRVLEEKRALAAK